MILSTPEFRTLRRRLLHIDEDGITDGRDRRIFDGVCAAYEAFGRHMSITDYAWKMIARVYREQQPRFVD